MERYSDPFPHFVVGLEFTEVEVNGIRHLFYADLVEIGPPSTGVQLTLSGHEKTETTLMNAGMFSRQVQENLFL
jgi:hypothetical protein